MMAGQGRRMHRMRQQRQGVAGNVVEVRDLVLQVIQQMQAADPPGETLAEGGNPVGGGWRQALDMHEYVYIEVRLTPEGTQT
jgi:hypothetical protein